MKKIILAAAAAGALSLGTLSFAAPGFAAAGFHPGTPVAGSNVIQARCWRNAYGRTVCNNRPYQRCWWRYGRRICRW